MDIKKTIDSAQTESQSLLLNPTPIRDEKSVGNIKIQHYNLCSQYVEDTHPYHSLSVLHAPISMVQRKVGDQVQDGATKAGDVSLIPANMTHHAYWEGQAIFTVFLFSPQFISNVAYEYINSDRIELLPHLWQTDPMINGMGHSFKLQLESRQPFHQEYIDRMALFAGVHLIENYSSDKYKLPENTYCLPSNQTREVIDYINTHLNKDLSLTQLSNLLSMSHCHFSRLFKKSTGVSPGKYVTNRRVEEAKYLLKKTNLDIETIAKQVGFFNSSHLCLAFNQRSLPTPSRYRKML
jgi:AraC family transcriptional regulator